MNTAQQRAMHPHAEPPGAESIPVAAGAVDTPDNNFTSRETRCAGAACLTGCLMPRLATSSTSAREPSRNMSAACFARPDTSNRAETAEICVTSSLSQLKV